MEIKAEKVKPYASDLAKTGQVEAMFDSIAPAYDNMNRLMTFGIDRLWRRKAVSLTAATRPRRILDVATGTGDFAIALARKIDGCRVDGVDLSDGMMEIGRKKVEKAGLADRISFAKGNCLHLPYPDNTFDAVTVAFGVRNFENLKRGYAEMARVLRPGGQLCVVELAVPESPLVRPFYKFYTSHIIPAVGRLVSSDPRAYTYLPESIAAMPASPRMLELMADSGFDSPRILPLTFGVCAIHTGTKK